jgi:hypothetical protein
VLETDDNRLATGDIQRRFTSGNTRHANLLPDCPPNRNLIDTLNRGPVNLPERPFLENFGLLMEAGFRGRGGGTW